MGRVLTWLGGALGLAALWRFLRREQQAAQRTHQPDHAEELRAKLEQAREAADDRDEFDAAEGQPVDEVGAPVARAEPPVAAAEPPVFEPEPQVDEPEPPVDEAEPPVDEAELPVDEAEPRVDEPEQPSLDERRRAIHEKAQQALGEMNRPGAGD